MAPHSTIHFDVLSLLPQMNRTELEILAGEVGFEPSEDDRDDDLRAIILENEDKIAVP